MSGIRGRSIGLRARRSWRWAAVAMVAAAALFQVVTAGASAKPRRQTPRPRVGSGEHLYWVNGFRSIVEANLDGSDARDIVPARNARGIAVGGGHIYWTSVCGDPCKDKTGTVNEANLDGSDPKTIVTGQDSPSGIAVASGHVYWGDVNQIREANLDGSDVHNFYGSFAPGGVAADSTHVYWVVPAFGSGAIYRANLDGSDTHTILTGQTNTWGIAADSSHVYWANHEDGTILMANPDGGAAKAIVTGQRRPYGVALAGGHLYWANIESGTIHEANLNGSDPKAITANQDPYGLAAGGP